MGESASTGRSDGTEAREEDESTKKSLILDIVHPMCQDDSDLDLWM